MSANWRVNITHENGTQTLFFSTSDIAKEYLTTEVLIPNINKLSTENQGWIQRDKNSVYIEHFNPKYKIRESSKDKFDVLETILLQLYKDLGLTRKILWSVEKIKLNDKSVLSKRTLKTKTEPKPKPKPRAKPKVKTEPKIKEEPSKERIGNGLVHDEKLGEKVDVVMEDIQTKSEQETTKTKRKKQPIATIEKEVESDLQVPKKQKVEPPPSSPEDSSSVSGEEAEDQEIDQEE